MFRCNWRSNAAIVGWLIFGLIASVSEGRTEPPKSTGVAESPPSVKGSSSANTNDGHYGPSQLPVPVRIIEDPGESQHAREREQKSDEHESDDLDAQQRAATAAERAAGAGEGQVIAAWWQFGIALAGTAGLLYSLWLTREALQVAQRAIAVSERAWIKTEMTADSPLKFYRAGGGDLALVALNKNIGNAPALNASTLMAGANDIGDIPDIVHRLKTEGIASHPAAHGLVVLPADSYERPWGITFDPPDTKTKLFMPAIICCVTYNSVHDSDVHQTCTVFMVSPDRASGRISIKYGESVPKEYIRFDPWAGGFAS